MTEKNRISEDKASQIKDLEQYREAVYRYKARRQNLNLVIRIMMGLVLSAVCIYITFFSSSGFETFTDNLIFLVPKIIFLLIATLFTFWTTRPPRDVDTRLISIQNEIDLLNIDFTSLEIRAEKLFKSHQTELERYYNQTLQHSSWIFIAGIVCIGIGFIIVIITLSSVRNIAEMNERIVTGAVGFLSTLVSNLIGAIYLKMYSETVKSLTEFHNRLVKTHFLHFANFLAAKIKDDSLREKTLGELALEIVRYDDKPSSQK